MNLDSQMIVSLLNFVKILNVKFRSKDITDDTRKKLKPLMKEIDEDSMTYLKLLRKPGNISTTKLLQEFRKISKEIRKSTNETIVEKTTVAVDFINLRIEENDEVEEPEIVVEDSPTSDSDSTEEAVTDTEEAGDTPTNSDEETTITDTDEETITVTNETDETGENEDVVSSDDPVDVDENENEDIVSTDEPVDVDANDSTDGNG